MSDQSTAQSSAATTSQMSTMNESNSQPTQNSSGRVQPTQALAFAPVIPLQGGLGGMARSIFELFGMGSIVDAIGPMASLGLLFGLVMVLGGASIALPKLMGDDGSSTSTSTSSSSSNSDGGLADKASKVTGGSGSGGDAPDLEDQDDDLITEAATRLEREDEPVTGENLREKLEEIEQEKETDERKGKTGAVRTPDERGEAARLSVSPERIEENETYIKRTADDGNEVYAREMIIHDFPSRVSYGWMDRFFTSGLETKGADVRVSYHMFPRDRDTMMKKLNIRATRLTSKIRRKEEEGKVNTTEEEEQLEQIERLREGLTRGDTKIFDFSLYLEVVAEDEKSLNNGTQEVKQILAQSNAKVTPLHDRQNEVQQAMAPLGNDPVRKTQIMDLESLGTTFPFIEPSVVQPTGVLMGFSKVTNSPVAVDRFELSGHSMLISGKIGSGKSYLAKLIIWRRLMMDPDTEVLIIDPVGGMRDLVQAVGGQSITIDNDTIINPMEIQQAEEIEDPDELDENPYDAKIRSVMGMFMAHFSSKRDLDIEEEGILRRAVKFAYLKKGITRDLSTHHHESPTVQDVLDILRHMADGEKPGEYLDVPQSHAGYVDSIMSETSSDISAKNRQRIANYAHSVLLGLEDFQRGGQRANLNGNTNVNIDDRVVQFDLSNVADGNNEGLLMHIVLDWLFQRAKASTTSTLVTIDEAHYMLRQEQALDMLNLYVRHSRHYESGVTLISQTVDEFMKNEQSKEIYDQCDIRALMRHQDIGKEAMKALDLTPRERDFVLQAQAGNSADFSESLLYVSEIGKMRLRVLSNPFEHHIVDGDANVWAYMYQEDMVDWQQIPREEQGQVKSIIESQQSAPASAD